jgi:hypothetical protein
MNTQFEDTRSASAIVRTIDMSRVIDGPRILIKVLLENKIVTELEFHKLEDRVMTPESLNKVFSGWEGFKN